jgi:hypothetical protein
MRPRHLPAFSLSHARLSLRSASGAGTDVAFIPAMEHRREDRHERRARLTPEQGERREPSEPRDPTREPPAYGAQAYGGYDYYGYGGYGEPRPRRESERVERERSGWTSDEKKHEPKPAHPDGIARAIESIKATLRHAFHGTKGHHS